MGNIPIKKIEIKAYELWEQAGKPIGDEVEFWFRAKEILFWESINVIPFYVKDNNE